jgi:hypothetical protein
MGNAHPEPIPSRALAKRGIDFPWHRHGSSFFNGNQLKAWMDSQDPVESGAFLGYVAGASDAVNDDKTICAPRGFTIGQAEAIVRKYIQANPEKWSERADQLVAQALKQAFPCPAKK